MEQGVEEENLVMSTSRNLKRGAVGTGEALARKKKQSKQVKDKNMDFILSSLLTCENETSAKAFLESKTVSKNQRKEAAELAGLASAWCSCDQGIDGNVEDLSSLIVHELW